MNDESEDNCDIADGHDVVRTKRRPPPSGVAALCTSFIISERGLMVRTVYRSLCWRMFNELVSWFHCCLFVTNNARQQTFLVVSTSFWFCCSFLDDFWREDDSGIS